MKRRSVLQSLLGVPAAAALPLPAAAQEGKPPASEMPHTPAVAANAVAPGLPVWFSKQQYAAVRRLCDLLMPAHDEAPGALAAGVPQFLDFLLAQSPADRQALYREGQEELNAQARRRYRKPFADLAEADAAALLAPLAERWTYAGPSAPLPRFLRAAKDDVFSATVNSRQWADAFARRDRRAAGVGIYWFPVEPIE